MDAFFEVAYAAVSQRLCLFTGTGFSKAVSADNAPGWQELLERVCDCLSDGAALKLGLFPADRRNPLSLEESAQVIDLALAKEGKRIHQQIADEIRKLKPEGNNKVISDFLNENRVRIVTTNYDKLAEELASTFANACQSISPGFPIPRAPARTSVYHIHGSVDAPAQMVVTSDDYFSFINGESYFSRKLSTILHENTVVILGYSLGDTNLKAIINDYRKFSRTNSTGSNLFLVARSKVETHLKDYYSHCYGIRVLDNLAVHDFFSRVNDQMEKARSCHTTSIDALRQVLFEDRHFRDDYLKLESAFFEIIAAVAALGRSINDPAIVHVLDDVIRKKIVFTGENGAWEQYEHLAKWLCYLASILELSGTSIEATFLTAVLKSMDSMAKNTWGFSWHAYTSWNTGWGDILPVNRAIVRRHVEAHCTRKDALELVKRG